VVHPLFAAAGQVDPPAAAARKQPPRRGSKVPAPLQPRRQPQRWNALPPELWRSIGQCLDAGTSVARLSCVCRSTRSLSLDEELWKHACIVEYRTPDAVGQETNGPSAAVSPPSSPVLSPVASHPTMTPSSAPCCSVCGAREATLRRCSCCKAARYCSVACQRQHWHQHKHNCRPCSRKASLCGRRPAASFSWKELYVFNHGLLREVLLSPTLQQQMARAYPTISTLCL
jgi:hypothetical protein